MRPISSLVVLVGLAACGGDERKPEPEPEAPVAVAVDAAVRARGDGGVKVAKPDARPGEEVPDVAVVGPKMIAFFEGLATAAKEADGDCARIVATFEVMFDESEELLKQAGKIEKDRDAEKQWKEEFGERTGEIRKELGEALKPCMADDKMAAFFDAL
jgi:hypothetical protein